jgi:HicA toxin of bacterial toxin-antitoxin,
VSRWPSTKAKRVQAALLRLGWHVKQQSGSHQVQDDDELGPRMLARIAKHTGLRPDDL